MGTLSSRESEQSKQPNVFIPIRLRSHFAQTANRPDFFPIAAKTMKYVCYNRARNQMNEPLVMSPITQ